MIVRNLAVTDHGSALEQLTAVGESLWYDNLRRGLIRSGELARMTREDGIVGVTSNPSIFEKAISGSTDYDEALHALVAQGRSPEEILETLVVEDIRKAADVLRPVFDRTNGRDGYVSVEVAPRLAHDAPGTVIEAKRLWREIDRPNLMVKVPGTKEGLLAISELTESGISVNVTLIFSVARYAEVALAFMEGLERRVKRHEPLSQIASVASFFVSRVDTAVDARLPASSPLRGRAAIANSKLAYARYRELIASERWRNLAARGARPQRVLWASTSRKDPARSSVLYVEELIGADTVNTVTQATLHAFLDHGKVRPSLTDDLEGAKRALAELEAAGVDLEAVCEELVRAGVAAFADAFSKLAKVIEARRQATLESLPRRTSAKLGVLQKAVDSRVEALGKADFVRRLWKKDPTLWKDDAADRAVARNRLGWLTVLETMREQTGTLRALAREVRDEGYRRVLLLGMGGSSLCPEVLERTFGVVQGFLPIEVLDSTDPAAIRAAEEREDLAKTIFLVSSKSGTTTEPLSLYRYFQSRVNGGRPFIAVTDPKTPLERVAREAGFRRVFTNMPDIGGRYSALSYFGLVPAALHGIDLERLLDEAERMAEACASCVSVADNPGVRLGAILGEAARSGRDKLTLVLSPEVSALGSWLEQLVAESTGKDGRGIVPIDGEPVGAPEEYGEDRLFVYVRFHPSDAPKLDDRVAALEAAGQPIVRIELRDRYDLGSEFFRWEFAIAVIGSILGIDPFDEPNVQESKDLTNELLVKYRSTRKLDEGPPLAEKEGIKIFADASLSGPTERTSLRGWLGAHLARAKEGDFVAWLTYAPRSAEVDRELEAMRVELRRRTRLATTAGYGPRFQHSTGQLHKGGPNRGVFLQITHDDASDLPIPGESYGFSTLKQAQALGDFVALERHGRRVLRCHVTGDFLQGLRRIRAELETSF